MVIKLETVHVKARSRKLKATWRLIPEGMEFVALWLSNAPASD